MLRRRGDGLPNKLCGSLTAAVFALCLNLIDGYQSLNANTVRFSPANSFEDDGPCCDTPPWVDQFTELCQLCLFKVAYRGAPNNLRCRWHAPQQNYLEVSVRNIVIHETGGAGWDGVRAQCPTSFWHANGSHHRNGFNTYSPYCTKARCPAVNLGGAPAPTTAIPTTALPTNFPSNSPTISPSAKPSASPTWSPTVHACRTGDHGCDTSEYGICFEYPDNEWMCGCAHTHRCVPDCNATGHTCQWITRSPSGSPSSSIPTSSPTLMPSTAPTMVPFWFTEWDDTPDSNNNDVPNPSSPDSDGYINNDDILSTSTPPRGSGKQDPDGSTQDNSSSKLSTTVIAAIVAAVVIVVLVVVVLVIWVSQHQSSTKAAHNTGFDNPAYENSTNGGAVFFDVAETRNDDPGATSGYADIPPAAKVNGSDASTPNVHTGASGYMDVAPSSNPDGVEDV